MLPKKERFTRKGFEEFIQKNPYSIYNKVGTFKFLKGNNQFSVVVSSKHCKRATVRNKTKRRVYAIVHSFLKKEHTEAVSGVFYLSKQSYFFSFQELELLIYDMLQRAYEAFK